MSQTETSTIFENLNSIHFKKPPLHPFPINTYSSLEIENVKKRFIAGDLHPSAIIHYQNILQGNYKIENHIQSNDPILIGQNKSECGEYIVQYYKDRTKNEILQKIVFL